MSAVVTPVDETKLLVEYLLDALSTVYPPLFDRVYGDVILPPGAAGTPNEFPLVTLETFGPGRSANGWLQAALVQFNVWAGADREEAKGLANAVRVAMADANVRGTYTEGTVTGSKEVTTPQPLYDRAAGRTRYTFTIQVFTHP